MAYARSSADLLTKLIQNEQMGSYQWEVCAYVLNALAD